MSFNKTPALKFFDLQRRKSGFDNPVDYLLGPLLQPAVAFVSNNLCIFLYCIQIFPLPKAAPTNEVDGIRGVSSSGISLQQFLSCLDCLSISSQFIKGFGYHKLCCGRSLVRREL